MSRREGGSPIGSDGEGLLTKREKDGSPSFSPGAVRRVGWRETGVRLGAGGLVVWVLKKIVLAVGIGE